MMTTNPAAQPERQACAIARRPRGKFPWLPNHARFRPWLRLLRPCDDIHPLSVSCRPPGTEPFPQERAPASCLFGGGNGVRPGPRGEVSYSCAVERRRLATRPRAIRSGWRSFRRSVVVLLACYDGMGREQGATVTDLRSDKLLEEVRRALKAEGCRVEVEIVKLLGAAPGQRNWEIATVGPNTAAPDVRRCIVEVQTRLGQKFQLRSRQRA